MHAITFIHCLICRPNDGAMHITATRYHRSRPYQAKTLNDNHFYFTMNDLKKNILLYYKYDYDYQ